MKTLKHTFKVSLIALLMATGCGEEFIELSPHQSVTEDQALVVLDDFKAAITGAYDRMSRASYYGRYFVLVPDVMTDDVKQNSQANRAKEYSEFSANATHFIALDAWTSMYRTVAAVNNIINAEPNIPAGLESDFNQVVGEAYAIRGLVYFDLVRLFAQHYSYTPNAAHPGVPIVLEFDLESGVARASVKEVYDQVINDLTKGIGLMTDDYPNGSRISKEAAQALLARVYLYQGDWANAEAMATNVINSGKFGIVSNSQYVASFSQNSSNEALFQFMYLPEDNNGSDALGGMYNVTGYGDYLPTTDLLNLIPAGDVRAQLYVDDSNLAGVFGPKRVGKYPSNQGLNSTKVIRMSEVYLIRAEARAQLGTNTAGAQADLDMIRKRARASAANVTATGQALVDEILLERRIELAFEGHRLWDLMRYKRGFTRNNCTAPPCAVSYPNDRFILPIPQDEINVSGIAQNPDY